MRGQVGPVYEIIMDLLVVTISRGEFDIGPHHVPVKILIQSGDIAPPYPVYWERFVGCVKQVKVDFLALHLFFIFLN